MNYKFLCILFVIYTCIFLSLQAVTFVSRPDDTRINRIIDHYSTNYGTNDYIFDYIYNSAGQSFIDSIITTIENDNIPLSITRYRYTHSLELVHSQTVKDYFEYKMPENILNKHYKFVTDEYGNALETLIVQSELPLVHIKFHYNAAGLADSIYYLFHPDTTDILSYHNIFYDENNRLSYSVLYQWQNNDWVPQRKITQHFGQYPDLYINPLDYSNFRQYNLRDGFEDLTAILDRFWCPDSISATEWDGNEWVNCVNNMYMVWGSENGISVNINDVTMGIIHNYNFNTQGILTSYNDNMIDLLMHSYTVIWENIVPVTDECQSSPPVLLSVSAYPNPFKSNLNIKFTGNDKAPSDISIYNIKGQLIRSWKDNKSTEISWDGKDIHNQPVSNGVYLIKTKQGNSNTTTKVLRY